MHYSSPFPAGYHESNNAHNPKNMAITKESAERLCGSVINVKIIDRQANKVASESEIFRDNFISSTPFFSWRLPCLTFSFF